MAGLAALLQDANYTEANPETRAEIFKRFSATDPDYTGANPETQAAIQQRFGVAQPQAARAPQPSEASRLARQGGLLVRRGIEGVAQLPGMLATGVAGVYNTLAPPSVPPDPMVGFGGEASFQFPDQNQAVSSMLTRMGLPEERGGVERVIGDVTRGVAGGVTQGLAAKASAPVSDLMKYVAGQFAANQGVGAVSSAAGPLAAGLTREGGGGPVAQTAAGLVGGVVPQVGASMVRNAPGNFIAKRVTEAENTPFAREGQRLREATGIDLTPGAATGNRLLTGLENTARQNPTTADAVQDIDVKIANQAMARINTIISKISDTKSSTATLGTKIEDTIKQAATSIDRSRNRAAVVDYGRVRELAGDAPVVRLQTFADELRAIISENQNVIGADAKKITDQATAMLKQTQAQGQTSMSTVTEAMKSRSFYGKAARGAVNVFDDIAPNANRTIASRLFRAINQDFDSSAANAGGELRSAFNKANSNFQRHSQSIDFLEKSALGKLVGDELVDAALSGTRTSTTAGETVIKKLMSMEPSTRKASIDILERWNFPLASELRASVLQDALNKAMSIPPSARGSSQIPLSLNKFVSALGGEKVSFTDQLKSYGFGDSAIKDIKDTAVAMMRAGDKTGFNYSGSGVVPAYMEIAEAAGQAVQGNLIGTAKAGISIAGKTIGLKKIAEAMASEEGRRALRTISSTRASPQAVVAAFATVNGHSDQ